MALSVPSLKGKIQTEIIAQFGAPADSAQLAKFCEAVAQAVYDEITSNAVVNSTGTVTSGPGAGGGVTTTGTVT